MNDDTGLRPGSAGDKALRVLRVRGGMYEAALACEIDVDTSECHAMLRFPVNEGFIKVEHRELGLWYDIGARRPGMPAIKPPTPPAPAAPPAVRKALPSAVVDPLEPAALHSGGILTVLPDDEVPRFLDKEHVLPLPPPASGQGVPGTVNITVTNNSVDPKSLPERLVNELSKASQTALRNIIRNAVDAPPSNPPTASELACPDWVLRRLAPRQQRMFMLYAAGHSDAHVKAALDIQPVTLKQYQSDIRRKLQIDTMEQCRELALRDAKTDRAKAEPVAAANDRPQPYAPPSPVAKPRRALRSDALLRFALFDDGEFEIHMDHEVLVLPKKHALQLINYVDRLAPQE